MAGRKTGGLGSERAAQQEGTEASTAELCVYIFGLVQGTRLAAAGAECMTECAAVANAAASGLAEVAEQAGIWAVAQAAILSAERASVAEVAEAQAAAAAGYAGEATAFSTELGEAMSAASAQVAEQQEGLSAGEGERHCLSLRSCCHSAKANAFACGAAALGGHGQRVARFAELVRCQQSAVPQCASAACRRHPGGIQQDPCGPHLPRANQRQSTPFTSKPGWFVTLVWWCCCG